MSEKSIARQRAGLVRRAKTNWRKTRILVGFTLLANSCWQTRVWQTRCVHGRRSVRCSGGRSKSEISA